MHNQIHRAREVRHDTLGLTTDPETLGVLEFSELCRNLTERLVAIASRGAGKRDKLAEAIAYEVWEPAARTLVRAMVRRLCAGFAPRGSTMRYGRDDLKRAAVEALASVCERLGEMIRDRRATAVARQIACAFADTERFRQPAELRCRTVPYSFWFDRDVLIVTKQGEVA